METSKSRQEKLVIVAGFALIAIVALATFSKTDFKKNNTPVIPENPEISTISADELYQKINERESVLIIDVRSIQDFEKEHILDSVNVPLENISKAEVQNISSGNLAVLVGYDGNNRESYQIWKIFSQQFSNLKILTGGINGWKNDKSRNIVGSGDPLSFVDQSKVAFIKAEELKSIIDENKTSQYYILDIRTSASFAQGRIPNAQNISFNKIESMRKKIPIGKEIIVYGDDEKQGFHGGVRLFDLKFFSVRVLKEGFSGWKEKKYPVVSQ